MSLVRQASRSVHHQLLAQGVAPAFESLVGWEFAGLNTGIVPGLLGIRKFKKGFYEGPALASGPEPFVQGYNIPVRQSGLDAPHVAKPSDDRPKRFGFYRVHHVVPGARDSKYPNALLLDYGLANAGFLSLPRFLRDYLVQIYPDDDSLLLGVAYVALGPVRLRQDAFVLKRMNRHDFRGPAR